MAGRGRNRLPWSVAPTWWLFVTIPLRHLKGRRGFVPGDVGGVLACGLGENRRGEPLPWS